MPNQTYTVEFGVVKNPKDSNYYQLTCEPAVLRVAPGDEVVFYAGGLPFSVVAKGSPPLDLIYIQSTDRKKVTVRDRETCSGGVYPLACSIFYGDKIYMDANCPILIIDPGLSY